LNLTLTKIGIIAIVDDDEPLREALGSVLKAAGFSIDTFASAEDFLDSPRRVEIACLILDVRLPGMSGIELQRRNSDHFRDRSWGRISSRRRHESRGSRLLEQARAERRVAEGDLLGNRECKTRKPSVTHVIQEARRAYYTDAQCNERHPRTASE